MFPYYPFLGWADSQVLTSLFQHQVLEMMLCKRRLSPEFARKLRSWQYSGGTLLYSCFAVGSPNWVSMLIVGHSL